MNDVINLFVPGRLCLFGEHSDWAGLFHTFNPDVEPGAAIVTGIEQGIYAQITKAEDFIVHNAANELDSQWINFRCRMDADELGKVALSDNFFAYVCGVASYLIEHYHVGGLDVKIHKMDMPIKRGLSSSASICVLVARAFNLLYKLNLNTIGEMMVAFRGEQRTRSRCGRLDQACAFGIKPVLMRFIGDEIRTEKLISKVPLYYIFADLMAEKDTIKILSDLNKCYPLPTTEIERNVHEALGKDNKLIIDRAEIYMREGNCEALGKLMTEAQTLFDNKIMPASPKELAAPILHSVLNDPNIGQYVYGGKGVGSQGDGAVQFLAKSKKSQQELYDYLTKRGFTAYKLTIPQSFGVSRAIIPVAGYGTRMYPFSKAIKKGFIPLVDYDGRMKPIILILLEQLFDSGIEEIILVIGHKEEEKLYQALFYPQLSDHEHKNSEYDKKLEKIGSIVRYMVQKERKGFGHAVYMCKNICGSEPYLILLGDTVYKSYEKANCSKQLIAVGGDCRNSLIAIHEIPLELVGKFGVVKGEWIDNEQTRMRITNCIEKPTIDYAKQHLAMAKDGKDHYYAIFGQYILTPEIFGLLEEAIREQGAVELDITGALNTLAENGKLFGTILNGKMFDFGNPEVYYSSVAGFNAFTVK